MSDFFSGVYGAQFPSVVMNQGPLPGMGGLPAPLHDTVDGRINYNNSLLGDIQPYAYGEPGYQSSQTSYLNIPHKIQKIVPYLYLPETDGTGSFQLVHPIDDGDLAFALRLDRNSEFCTGLNNKSVLRAGLGTAVDPLINLCTLNYILAGMQISTQLPETRTKWDHFLNHLDKDRFNGTQTQQYNLEDIKHVIRHLAKPFGIAHGSEKQGGQHEGGMSPVTWPVNFVITLTLDGKDANVVNIWHTHDIDAGSDLVLRLKAVPLPQGSRYVLNHFPKGLAEKTFSPSLLNQIAQAPGNHAITHVWQLLPDLFSLDVDETQEALFHPNFNGIALGFAPRRLPIGCWQEEGYWHIARAQVHSRKYGTEEFFNNDMANNLKTGHMDLTFQPTFYATPHRDFGTQNGPGATVTIPGHFMPPGMPPAIFIPPARRNVFNFIGSREDDESRKREWRQTLSLEMNGGIQPETTSQKTLDESKRAKNDEIGSMARLSAYLDTPLATVSSSSLSVERESNGGLLDSLREMGRPLESSVASGMILEDSSSTQNMFHVPKPGIKNAKRPPIRGKGVISAVLGADGSVTHEQSRML